MSDNALIRALRSFGQGASNAVASNVSAPVDGLAWLLRKGGLPIPANPVGGSDWMAQQGLTATPQNRIAGLLGETAGMVGPAVVQAAAPKIAGGLLALDDKAMDMARQGIERRMDASGMRLGAAEGLPSRGPAASAEWAGTNTPARKGESYADDMMTLVKQDIALKDFDPAMVRQGLIEWSQSAGIHPGHSLRAFMRQLNADQTISPARKQKILSGLSGQP